MRVLRARGDRVGGRGPVRRAGRAAAPGARRRSTGSRRRRRAALAGALALGPATAQRPLRDRRGDAEPARRRTPRTAPLAAARRRRAPARRARAPRRCCSPPGGCVADPIAVVLAVREGEPSLLDGADLRVLRVAGLDRADAAELLRRAGVDAGRASSGSTARPAATRSRCSSSPPTRARLAAARPTGPVPISASIARGVRCAASSRLARADAAHARCSRRPSDARRPRGRSRGPPRARLDVDDLAAAEEAGLRRRSTPGASSSATRSCARRSTPRRRRRSAARRTRRWPRRCPTATSTAAPGTWRRRRRPRRRRPPRALEQAGERARASAAPTRSPRARSSAARGWRPTTRTARGCCCAAADAAWLGGDAERTLALLDEAAAARAATRRCRPGSTTCAGTSRCAAGR